ncbi:MAG TPA: tRNA (adenosine(37)-N6)-threonylcarbamoyltransferase complex dimerization subunit type 1 TsaB, partial [Polyangiaceae bacterium]|nr:tRNA (adenosine(37)-N6)-threonylcarbamoyltransferase complex dimerization subunit type 1 TsaB [Polyangiaceae bacterium]
LDHHAEQLFAAIEAALATTSRSKRDLSRIACDVGPGSFTGVRVGVATAQGIAFALGIPCLGVGSLEAMAFAARGDEALAVLDAKKGEAFVASFDASGAQVGDAEHVALAVVTRRIEEARARGAAIVGEIADALVAGSARRSEAADLPDAAAVAMLAGLETDPRRRPSAPVYVRPPDAKPMAVAPPRPDRPPV